jgi:hypothetical protein
MKPDAQSEREARGQLIKAQAKLRRDMDGIVGVLVKTGPAVKRLSSL